MKMGGTAGWSSSESREQSFLAGRTADTAVAHVGRGVTGRTAQLLIAIGILWTAICQYSVAEDDPQPARKPAAPLAVAQDHLARGRYAQAEAAFTAIAPTERRAAGLGLARTLAAQGKLEEAEKQLGELARQDSHPDVLSEQARLAMIQGRLDETLKLAGQALAKEPKHLHARWLRAELYRLAGETREASKAYEWFIDYYNARDTIEDPHDVRLVGLAAAQFARWNRNSEQFHFLVNRLYPRLVEQQPNFWEAHLEAGLLYLEKFNEADAQLEFEKGLGINFQAPELHAALAELYLEKYDLERASREIEIAQKQNPKLVWALRLAADVRLFDFRANEAIPILEQARQLDPSDPRVLGRLAAAYGLVDGLESRGQSDSRMGRLMAEAARNNEHCGEFYLAAAEALDATRRFPAAAELYREAQKRMPQLVTVAGKLGLMYMRLGDEQQAAPLLKLSMRLDPFNVRVKNTLAVLNVLERYAVLETEHFVLKFDRGQDEPLARLCAYLLEREIYPNLTERLGYRPPDKTLIELFNRSGDTSGHGWFSARMTGQPYIGTVGACAGKMVAFASPGDLPRKYNVARMLRHEFTHVLNLQQTNFNIPHWYTEGLAMLHESQEPPAQFWEALARRVKEDRLFNLTNLNHGFIRPASSDEWTLAYCQAWLYARYFLQKFGPDANARLLAAYAANLSTDAALKKAFGVQRSEIEAGYLEHLKQIAAQRTAGPDTEAAETRSLAQLQKAVADNENDAAARARLAAAQLQRANRGEARKQAEAALALAPRDPLASCVAARLKLLDGDKEDARKLLAAALDENKPHPQVLALLASLLRDSGELDQAERMWRLGQDKFPASDIWPRALVSLYLEKNDVAKLPMALTRLAEIDGDDGASRRKLAQLHLAAKDYPAAARWAREALAVDAADAAVYADLAMALSGQGAHGEAAQAYELAVRIDGSAHGYRGAMVEAYLAAGDKAKARAALDDLIQHAPEHSLIPTLKAKVGN